jgi:TPR repeat protein
MQIQQARRILFGVVTTVMLAFGAAPIHVGSAAGNRDALAIAALDAIPAEDWLKQSSGALLDRVIAASSKESLDAAAAKDPRAQALVGSAHLSGLHGYAKSEAEAVKFYRLAADSNPIAQNNLGNLLLTGVASGGTPAPAEAAEMFRRAAKLGHPVAQANLGRLYSDGVGVEKDVAKAKEYLALAVAQGNPEAKDLLDTLKAREAAESEAEKWKRLEAAAATGDAAALRKLGEAYEEIGRKVFDAIKNNQFQAAVNASLKAPDRKKLRIAELADEHGMTALHWAVTNRNAAGVRWLLDKGPNLELKDDKGRTPLKIALDNKDVNAMTLLIASGAMTTSVLPGYDDELKVLKKTSDIVEFMISPKRCDAGDAALCYSIGLAYDNGTDGFSVNRKLAAGYYEKACARDIAGACTNLGLLYRNGRGVTKDVSRAAALYKKACDANEPSACSNLGLLHNSGEGVAKDESRATALFDKACTAGNAYACSLLGDQYGNGRGAARDEAKAAVNYTKACDGGIPESCTNLGYRYRNGQGVAKDLPKAVALYQKACLAKEPTACLNLGLLYNQGEGVPKDLAKAAPLYRTACDAGAATVQACHWLAGLHSNGEGVPKDTAKAVALYQKACDGKYAASCAVLGTFYYLGEVLPKDWPKAAALFERACDGDSATGCRLLSMSYGAGDGVAIDKTKAATLLAKACKLGDQKACPSQAAASAATAAAPAAAKPAHAACKIVKVQPGVDTVASVERDIQARGGSPITGGSGPSKYRISAMSGDYQDAGTDVMAVNYDFDAAGPAGRLVAVTVVNHAYTGHGYEKLLASRKTAAAAIVGPLQQKSATELVASAPGCQLRLLPNADTWFIYEVYQLPN